MTQAVAIPEIDKSKVLVPMLDDKGQLLRFTKEQQEILKTIHELGYKINEFNASQCALRVNSIWGKHRTAGTILRWLDREPIKGWLLSRLDKIATVNGFDKEEWESIGIKRIRGQLKETSLEFLYWKEYGKAKGWYQENPILNQQNFQINITQADGKE